MDSDTRSRCWIRLSLISVILLAGFPVDAQINCNNAIPNCATCETSALCTSCSRFYGLNPINHNNVQCKECKTNAFCSECANLTRCTKCNDTIKYGPDLNGVGTCSPCIPNCRSCASAGGGKCNACNGGYSLRTTPSYLCMLCATNCANCVNNGTGKCDVCNTKFGLTSSMTCADCAANCKTCFKAGAGSCDAYSCATSYGNFYQSCLTPVCAVGTAGCSACSNTTTDGVSCTQCSSGYLLTAATSTAPGFCKAKPTDACTSAPCKNSGSCVAQGTDSYKCTCAPGFTGTNCDTIFKACTSGPCQNGGSCADQANAYTCTCVPGYTGGNCQSNIDECASRPCKNGGSCKDMVNGYTCTCATGFSGPNCETVISTNACTSGPCQNSGSCVTQGTSYSCNCAPGYTGSNCQTNINECASVPCQNGGTCNDKVNGYDCTCGSGFSGPLCQTGVKACTSSPCLNGGSCTDQANAYTCMCVSGYSGVNCQSNIDECVSSPCKNGGSCKDKVNGYTCTCATGFSGPKCEAACATNCQNCSNAGATFCDNCMSGYILYKKKCAVGCTTGPTCQTCSADKINCADCTTGNTKTTSADGITTCTGPTKTIPDTNCTLPFTYKKQLYYSCIAITPGNYVCYGANCTWVNCQPTGANGTVYVAQNTTTSLTIAGYSSPTTVMSVNNWIVMQQRVSAAVSFNQSWVTYRNGFGQYDGNFWLGNEKIFQLTGAGGWRLRVEMLLSADRGWYSVEYNSFKVTNEADLYKLFLDGFCGDTGNSFMSPNINFQQNGMNFTTYDRKNDKHVVINNANFYQGGFWYKYDCDACLNSAYNKYVQWYQTPSGVTCDTCPIITVRMMIKKN